LLLELKRRDSSVLKRYALSGLSSASARLSADQRVPLNNVAAVFFPTLESLDGLASLILTLSQAGAAKLVLVGPMASTVLTTGHERHLLPVTTCDVPLDGDWYQVYKDEYLVAHAKSKREGGGLSFIYTLSLAGADTSFAVVPPMTTLDVLPDYVMERRTKGKDPALRCTIVTNNIGSCDAQGEGEVFFTQPSNITLDRGLFIRAIYQAQLLNQMLPFAYSFPVSKNVVPNANDHHLVSCSTLDLTTLEIYTTQMDEINASCTERGIAASILQPTILDQLHHAWYHHGVEFDENEIDLDEEEEESSFLSQLQYFQPVPYLLILGTGCASPSPRRGSSGYGLFLPHQDSQSLIGVLECGEGFLTNLARHLPTMSFQTVTDQLKQIRFIWISHAHLDHYGGLTTLLREIARIAEDTNQTKRMKTTSMEGAFPIVIAPSKVLTYVDTMLQCSNGKQVAGGRRLYYGVTHSEFETSPFCSEVRHTLFDTTLHQHGTLYQPIQILSSVAVEHCPHAHGLIIRIQVPGLIPFTLCYSGDTRPSKNLVRACCHKNDDFSVSLLLHEATFDDDDRSLAEAKRHSTVMEATQIAKDMNAQSCLLTHFSQRYPKHPPGGNVVHGVGFATDGMCIPLTPVALALLPQLSRQTNMVLDNNSY